MWRKLFSEAASTSVEKILFGPHFRATDQYGAINFSTASEIYRRDHERDIFCLLFVRHGIVGDSPPT
jgi:hypothetical protein